MPGLERQVFSGTAGALGMMISGCWIAWPTQFIQKMEDGQVPFNLTLDQQSWVVALMDFGNVISPIPTAYMMDSVGRKMTILITALVNLFSWGLVVRANGAAPLYVARVLAGIAKGMSFTVVPIYLAEIAEVKVRGAICTIFTILFFFGAYFEFTIDDYVSYELLNYILSLFPIVFFLLVFFMQESPYYLLMRKNRTGAEKSFFWLRGFNPEAEDATNQKAIFAAELDQMNEQVQKVTDPNKNNNII